MILVFGTICLDRVRSIPSFPKPGGFVEVTNDRMLLGGEAANTANALRTWGAEVALAGNAPGRGKNAELLKSLLDERGLHPIWDESAPNETPVCDVFLTPDGQRTMIGQGFSATDGTVDISRIPYTAGDWFTAEPNMAKTSRTVARAAHEAGMKLYLMDFFHDDEWIPPGAICQFGTDWVGEQGDPQANLRWCEAWSKKHQCTTILTDGGQGFYVSLPDGNAQAFPAFKGSGPAVDFTGAGDLFRAGMLYALQRDWNLGEQLQIAAAAGALICQSLGATVDAPTQADLRKLLRDNESIVKQYPWS